jgi:hypothetical protein
MLALKTCSACREQKDTSNFSNGSYYCKPCAAENSKRNRLIRRKDPEYIKNFNTKIVSRLQENKRKAVVYKGGKCFDCNQSFHECVYDFHHLDTNTKDQNPSAVLRLGFEKAIPELDKCVLLCANCHRLRHFSKDLKC